MKINKEKAMEVSFALLRIVAGILFLQHGGQKLFGWFGSGMSMGELPAIILVAGLLEVIGGVLVLAGAWVRPVAFVLSGEMAFAYFMAHIGNGFWPIQNGGEPAALFAFIFLFFAFHGAGKWSVDAWRASKKLGVQM